MPPVVDTLHLEHLITQVWEEREKLTPRSSDEIKTTVEVILDHLDAGRLRVCAKNAKNGQWIVHEWIKKAILLSFRLREMMPIHGGPGDAERGPAGWYDKVASKFAGWSEREFIQAGFRAVPNVVVRHSAYIAPGVVLMPSFVNLGAYVGRNTMIDSWVTVGSCAQIGENCHISSGVCIGGVLEPLQARPVIVEDHCFVGAGSQVTEGMVIEHGAVIAMGVTLGLSTKIIDRETGEVIQGRVPANSVVVPGVQMLGKHDLGQYCAVIVKRVDDQTRAKVSINDLLRES